MPGRPALYATTRLFLDDLNLRSLEELPPLDELGTLVEPSADAGVPPESESDSAMPVPVEPAAPAPSTTPQLH